MRRLLLLLLPLLLSVTSYAGDCNAPIAACASAELIKRDLTKGLPQQVSQNMTMTHVMRIDAEIHLYTQLSYDMALLAANIRSKGATPDDARRAMQVQAQNYFCSAGKLRKAVVEGVSFTTTTSLLMGKRL